MLGKSVEGHWTLYCLKQFLETWPSDCGLKHGVLPLLGQEAYIYAVANIHLFILFCHGRHSCLLLVIHQCWVWEVAVIYDELVQQIFDLFTSENVICHPRFTGSVNSWRTRNLWS